MCKSNVRATSENNVRAMLKQRQNSINLALNQCKINVEYVSSLMKNIYWKEKGQLDYRFNLKSLTEKNSEVGKPLPVNSVFKKPTLFLKGEKSGYIISSEQHIIDVHFRDNEVVEIAKAGHWLHAENPKQFYEEVSDFLD